MTITKLNESFYKVEGTPEQLQTITRRLTVIDANAIFDPMVKRGLKSDKVPFYVIEKGSLIIPAGLVQFLSDFNIQPIYSNEFSEQQIDDFMESFKAILPFEPYDYQELSIKESILKQQQLILAATGAGKSVIIAGLVEFFRTHGLRGLILVPSISLTTQLHNDFKSYGLHELYDNCRLIGGDNNEKNFSKMVSIGTWQSVMLMMNGETNTILADANNLHIDGWVVNKITKKNGKFKKITYSDGTTEIIPL